MLLGACSGNAVHLRCWPEDVNFGWTVMFDDLVVVVFDQFGGDGQSAGGSGAGSVPAGRQWSFLDLGDRRTRRSVECGGGRVAAWLRTWRRMTLIALVKEYRSGSAPRSSAASV